MAVSSTLRSVGLWSLLALQAYALQLHEQIPAAPAGWKQTGTPADNSQIVLQIALTQQNIDQLESHLQAVSTPGTATYGQYLDLDQINSIFGASNASKTAVTNWLQSSGVTSYTVQGDSVWFQTSVSKANSLLGTTFNHFTDAKGNTKLRTTQYSVPQEVASAIDLISPTTYFGNTKAQAAIPSPAKLEQLKRATVPASCAQNYTYSYGTYTQLTPDCLKTEYKINDYKPDPKAGSRLGFGSFLNESASFSDLFQFEKQFNIPAQNFSVVLVNPQDGATALPQPPDPANDGEANLDVQYQVGIAHPIPITEFITAGSPPYFPDPVEPAGTPNENEPYLPYFEFLLSKHNKDIPQVISNSYGDEEQTVPEKYAHRVCNLIGLLGIRGISLLESSGDEGVGAGCLSQDGKKPQFNPIFPATCPYITSVGGTVQFDPVQAWVGSSGGFSYYFKQPWYQAAAVGNYLTNHISAETKAYYGQYTDFTGRGFPDVSANSVDPDYTVVQAGVDTPSGGTSAAAPVTAAIVALLNDARLRAGKPALGFLNPLLYGFAYTAYDDVTHGQSDGCNGGNTQTGGGVPGAGVIPGAHWNATEGWDPVTGFGTPDFQKLLALALKY